MADALIERIERAEGPDGWIKHDGGPCPVSPNSRPLMRFLSGWDASDAIRRDRKWRASHADWSQCVAYLPSQFDG